MAFITNEFLRQVLASKGIDPDAPGVADRLAQSRFAGLIGEQPSEGRYGEGQAIVSGLLRNVVNTGIGVVNLPGNLLGAGNAIEPIAPSWAERANPIAGGIGNILGYVVPAAATTRLTARAVPAVANFLRATEAAETGTGFLAGLAPRAIAGRAAVGAGTLGTISALQTGSLGERAEAGLQGALFGAIQGGFGSPANAAFRVRLAREALAGTIGPPPVDIEGVPGPITGALFGGAFALLGGHGAPKRKPRTTTTVSSRGQSVPSLDPTRTSPEAGAMPSPAPIVNAPTASTVPPSAAIPIDDPGARQRAGSLLHAGKTFNPVIDLRDGGEITVEEATPVLGGGTPEGEPKQLSLFNLSEPESPAETPITYSVDGYEEVLRFSDGVILAFPRAPNAPESIFHPMGQDYRKPSVSYRPADYTKEEVKQNAERSLKLIPQALTDKIRARLGDAPLVIVTPTVNPAAVPGKNIVWMPEQAFVENPGGAALVLLHEFMHVIDMGVEDASGPMLRTSPFARTLINNLREAGYERKGAGVAEIIARAADVEHAPMSVEARADYLQKTLHRSASELVTIITEQYALAPKKFREANPVLYPIINKTMMELYGLTLEDVTALTPDYTGQLPLPFVDGYREPRFYRLEGAEANVVVGSSPFNRIMEEFTTGRRRPQEGLTPDATPERSLDALYLAEHLTPEDPDRVEFTVKGKKHYGTVIFDGKEAVWYRSDKGKVYLRSRATDEVRLDTDNDLAHAMYVQAHESLRRYLSQRRVPESLHESIINKLMEMPTSALSKYVAEISSGVPTRPMGYTAFSDARDISAVITALRSGDDPRLRTTDAEGNTRISRNSHLVSANAGIQAVLSHYRNTENRVPSFEEVLAAVTTGNITHSARRKNPETGKFEIVQDVPIVIKEVSKEKLQALYDAAVGAATEVSIDAPLSDMGTSTIADTLVSPSPSVEDTLLVEERVRQGIEVMRERGATDENIIDIMYKSGFDQATVEKYLNRPVAPLTPVQEAILEASGDVVPEDGTTLLKQKVAGKKTPRPYVPDVDAIALKALEVYGPEADITQAAMHAAAHVGAPISAIGRAAQLRDRGLSTEQIVVTMRSQGFAPTHAWNAAKFVTALKGADAPRLLELYRSPEFISARGEQMRAQESSAHARWERNRQRVINANRTRTASLQSKREQIYVHAKRVAEQAGRDAERALEKQLVEPLSTVRTMGRKIRSILSRIEKARKDIEENQKRGLEATKGRVNVRRHAALQIKDAGERLDALRKELADLEIKYHVAKQTVDTHRIRVKQEILDEAEQLSALITAERRRPRVDVVQKASLVTGASYKEALQMLGKAGIPAELHDILPPDVALDHLLLRMVSPEYRIYTPSSAQRMLRAVSRFMRHLDKDEKTHFPMTGKLAELAEKGASWRDIYPLLVRQLPSGFKLTPRRFGETFVWELSSPVGNYYFDTAIHSAVFFDLLMRDASIAPVLDPPGTPTVLGLSEHAAPRQPTFSPIRGHEEKGNAVPPPDIIHNIGTQHELGMWDRFLGIPEFTIARIERLYSKSTGKPLGLLPIWRDAMEGLRLARYHYNGALAELDAIANKNGVKKNKATSYRIARALRTIDAQAYEIQQKNGHAAALAALPAIRASVARVFSLSRGELQFAIDLDGWFGKRLVDFGLEHAQTVGYMTRMKLLSRDLEGGHVETDPMLLELQRFYAAESRSAKDASISNTGVSEPRKAALQELGLASDAEDIFATLSTYARVGYRHKYVAPHATVMQGVIDLHTPGKQEPIGPVFPTAVRDLLTKLTERMMGIASESDRAGNSRRAQVQLRTASLLKKVTQGVEPVVPEAVHNAMTKAYQALGLSAVTGETRGLVDYYTQLYRTSVFGLNIMRAVRDIVTTDFFLLYPRFDTATYSAAFKDHLLNFSELVSRYQEENYLSQDAYPELVEASASSTLLSRAEKLNTVYRRADVRIRVLATRLAELSVPKALAAYKKTGDFRDFLEISGLDTYQASVTRAIQDELKALADRGNEKELIRKAVFLHQDGAVANFMRINAPPIYDSAVGRFVGQFGSWSFNAVSSLWWMYRAPLENGAYDVRAYKRASAVASRYALASGAAYAIGANLNIDTSDWIPFFHNIWFTGGPGLSLIERVREVTGGDPVVAARLKKDPSGVLTSILRLGMPVPAYDTLRRAVPQLLGFLEADEEFYSMFDNRTRRAAGLVDVQRGAWDKALVAAGFTPFQQGLSKYGRGVLVRGATAPPRLLADALHAAVPLFPPGSREKTRGFKPIVGGR